jgi:uncharacterized damage-inducible protein DinB
MLAELRRLFEHARWADGVLLGALKGQAGAPAAAWSEFGHILGAGETWLSRLERRASRAPVWPDVSHAELEALAGQMHGGYAAYLSALTETGLAGTCSYTNTAGRTFENPVGEILLHVAMHGQYHRGKVNLLLRQAGLNPAPTDYIAFVRGAAAAVTPVKPA